MRVRQATMPSYAKELDVLVAETLTERALGLSGIDSLEADGMLFKRPVQDEAAFHMAGVKFPILIAFFDRDGGLVDQVTMEPGNSVYRPARPFKYVLELTDLTPLEDDSMLDLEVLAS